MGERTLVPAWQPGAAPRSYPLGHTISGNPHSVVVSLPTRADVIGYEEKEPAVVAALRSGYPRFFRHFDVRELIAALREILNLPPGELYLLSSGHLLEALIGHAGVPPTASGEWEDLTWVVYPATEVAVLDRVRRFLQRTGGAPTSRRAEDALITLGRRRVPFPEAQRPAEGGQIEAALAPYFGVAPEEIWLTQGGMNAFYALFRAVKAAMAPAGRRRWVQLGWLYVDTIKILETFGEAENAPVVWDDVLDLAGLEAALTPMAGEIAAIVSEVPSNPLIQTPEVAALRALADRLGCLLILDPSIASVGQVDVMPWADAVVTSLTKYTAREGDVMLGAAVIDPSRPHAAALRQGVERWRIPPYGRDLTRFAAQLDGWAAFTAKASATAVEVAQFLEAHPAVDRVWWSGAVGQAERFAQVARDPRTGGCAVVSFTVKGDWGAFYDRVEVAKGPSFGTAFTLLSPFIYLAHYDLIQTPEGQARLAAAGVPPGLLRLSVGAEPADVLLATLAAALPAQS